VEPTGKVRERFWKEDNEFSPALSIFDDMLGLSCPQEIWEERFIRKQYIGRTGLCRDTRSRISHLYAIPKLWG